jgi:hypothetical protein
MTEILAKELQKEFSGVKKFSASNLGVRTIFTSSIHATQFGTHRLQKLKNLIILHH